MDLSIELLAITETEVGDKSWQTDQCIGYLRKGIKVQNRTVRERLIMSAWIDMTLGRSNENATDSMLGTDRSRKGHKLAATIVRFIERTQIRDEKLLVRLQSSFLSASKKARDDGHLSAITDTELAKLRNNQSRYCRRRAQGWSAR